MKKPQIDPWIFWPSLVVILLVTVILGVNLRGFFLASGGQVVQE
ncbi:hypothetical protein ACE99V_011470 [Brevibacillus sp. H7]